MSANPNPIVVPAGGQTWRAPAPRVKGGFRYVVIEQVRRKAEPAYVNAHEVTASGARVRRDPVRTYRNLTFTIFLHPATGTLPSPYERVTA